MKKEKVLSQVMNKSVKKRQQENTINYNRNSYRNKRKKKGRTDTRDYLQQ